MSRLDAIFQRCRREQRTALMPFITAGHPTLDVTEQVIPALAEAGADVIELGVPFSDPIADGPVIAGAMHAALQAGVTPHAVFEMTARVRPHTDVGLIAMVSASIVMRMGGEDFMARAADAGLDGVIVPDIDLDAATELARDATARDLGFTLLAAPTTRDARLARITPLCRGFVYALARTGITGERDAAPDVETLVARIRSHTDLPVAVGFGISRPEHIAAVGRHADAAIVGSALVRRMGESDDPVAAAASFVRELARGCAARTAPRHY